MPRRVTYPPLPPGYEFRLSCKDCEVFDDRHKLLPGVRYIRRLSNPTPVIYYFDKRLMYYSPDRDDMHLPRNIDLDTALAIMAQMAWLGEI